MPFKKIAMATIVVCLSAASIADADQRGERRRSRGRDTRVVVQPRIVVRPPVVARRYGSPRVAARYAGRLAYRPVHRPGIGFGIYIGSPYRYGSPYAYPGYGRPYYPTPYPYGYGYYGYATPYPSYGYTTPYPTYPPYPSPSGSPAGIYAGTAPRCDVWRCAARSEPA